MAGAGPGAGSEGGNAPAVIWLALIFGFLAGVACLAGVAYGLYRSHWIIVPFIRRGSSPQIICGWCRSQFIPKTVCSVCGTDRKSVV